MCRELIRGAGGGALAVIEAREILNLDAFDALIGDAGGGSDGNFAETSSVFTVLGSSDLCLGCIVAEGGGVGYSSASMISD